MIRALWGTLWSKTEFFQNLQKLNKNIFLGVFIGQKCSFSAFWDTFPNQKIFLCESWNWVLKLCPWNCVLKLSPETESWNCVLKIAPETVSYCHQNLDEISKRSNIRNISLRFFQNIWWGTINCLKSSCVTQGRN